MMPRKPAFLSPSVLPETKSLINQVFCCDCFAIFPKIPAETADLILTDPPYGISYQNHFSHQMQKPIHGDQDINYPEIAKECFRILKPDRHAYFFTRFDTYPWHYQRLTNAGFQIKNCMVIEKGNIGGCGDLKGSYANNAEWVIFCQKGRRKFQQTTLLKNRHPAGTKYHAQRKLSKEYKTRFNCCWFGPDYPKSTYSAPWLKSRNLRHPTIKNVEFLSWLIQISSLPGELVFDPFMGSGSTPLAAIKTDRHYLCCEIDPEYCNLFYHRLRQEH